MADVKKKPNNNSARVVNRQITDEMKESYLDYAMSVIVARALPDVRDGLKPVHRRILYAMWDLGLKSSAKFRKSATVVGEVLGKYHPHGDVAVYDSLVRLAQDFSLRYPLVDGQGNFGSMDGDAAAAMRYTEAKLDSISDEILLDIEKETVDFVPNYDSSKQEPKVLPAKLPNLLLNGTMGIAVGMATNIPPHNLGELTDGINHVIDNPKATVDDLMKFVKGPDFPTGGSIYDINEIKQAYATGKGGIVMRAKTEIVEEASGTFKIIVTEVPYQVNKADLITKIAQLVQDKKIEGIRDLRDESDRDGVRIVIDLKKDSYPKKILNRLFTHTSLQDTFHVNMLALVDGIQPRVLNLKMIIDEYIKHRQIVVQRRTQFDLNRAEERAHILKGLKIALDHLDAVIKLIKRSKDKEEAHKQLRKQYKLSDKQATAILEMKLQQLAGLERLKIEQELKEKIELIKQLKNILASPKKILGIIKDELVKLKDKYSDERRTQVFPNPVDKFTQEDLIPKEPTMIVVTRDGYIKRQAPNMFKTQSRGGKGVIGLTTKEQDVVDHIFSTNTHADILFFTTRGRVFQLKAYDIPSASRTAKGQALVNFLQLAPEEKATEAIPLEDLSDHKYLVMVTRLGVIKKVDIQDFIKVRRSGLIAIKLRKDDNLEWVKPSSGKDEIILVTSLGQSIRFKEKDIRPMGRNAAGVRGIRLKKNDQTIGMDIVFEGKTHTKEQLLVVMENGYGKRTNLNNYKVQRRGGSGVKTAKITEKTGKAVVAFIVNAQLEKEDLVIISNQGQLIRLPLKSVSVLGRATQGVRLMRFKEKDNQVASVTFV
ncbi:MAG: DNA gyrase subunit A [Candidatus Kerfeldbacteria bacterium CG_4_10_14_0_8_um_filter_42_10]|uniref:DNA gyrase subunit A n=1 Tax=Candidatus Kerfeldbacteria bacterium CG_4_10_14_0_8_um_filter_42_10 TaxID=2014248 RepID=A0A2M7RIR6_9BACT|nr:MAG: DNA gyrase subunit A [Candidatus Kerfeldbacteria bacterium CG_4_10_14_0_8_um_filter_42_10]